MRILALSPLLLLGLAGCGSNESLTENASEVTENGADTTVDTRPKIFCDVIGERTTEEDCEDLRALQMDVRPAPAALDAPAAMTRGKPYEVTLVVDRPEPPAPPPPPPPPPPPEPDDNAVNLVDNAVAPEPGDRSSENAVGEPMPTANEVVAELPGEDHPFRANVGRYMVATLTGSGFAIKLISPEDGCR